MSPFVAIGSALAMRTVHALAWVGLAVGLIALLRGRWFCRWICPLGTCADGVSHVGRRLARRPLKMPSLGPWIVWLTLGGAAVGYPLLLWLDPLGLFAGLFRLVDAPWTPATVCGALPAMVVLGLGLVWPYAWCRRICPLGSLQDIGARAAAAIRPVFPRKPTAATAAQRTLARRTVLGSLVGVMGALTLRPARGSQPPPLRPPGAVDRRHFPGVCIRCGNCVRACPTGIVRPDLGNHGPTNVLTPTLDFRRGYCREDCTACTGVCPSGALRRLSVEDKRRMRLGLPQVDMNVCLLGEDRECSECMRWCPYEAVRYVFSEASYTLTPVINASRCTGCGACEMVCPVQPKKAIVIIADS